MPDAQIALGLAALGRPAYINVAHGEDVADSSVEGMEGTAHAVLDAAYDGGVRWFDAARSYGRAEAFLASWLARRGLQPGDVTVSSKWGYRYTAGWRIDVAEHEVKDLSVEHFRTQWRETRELLGDYVGLYQIHSATLESGVLDDPAVRHELEALRARGIRVGLTVTGAEQAPTIDRALATGGSLRVAATRRSPRQLVGRARAKTQSRSRQPSHGLGQTSYSAERRPWRSSKATCLRSTSHGTTNSSSGSAASSWSPRLTGRSALSCPGPDQRACVRPRRGRTSRTSA
jgi:aryl-alcohol dehydrogenase-like predicted oxidoreductase